MGNKKKKHIKENRAASQGIITPRDSPVAFSFFVNMVRITQSAACAAASFSALYCAASALYCSSSPFLSLKLFWSCV